MIWGGGWGAEIPPPGVLNSQLTGVCSGRTGSRGIVLCLVRGGFRATSLRHDVSYFSLLILSFFPGSLFELLDKTWVDVVF